jgi:hypothetical protein
MVCVLNSWRFNGSDKEDISLCHPSNGQPAQQWWSVCLRVTSSLLKIFQNAAFAAIGCQLSLLKSLVYRDQGLNKPTHRGFLEVFPVFFFVGALVEGKPCPRVHLGF